MRRSTAAVLLLFALTGAACPGGGDVAPREPRSTDQPRPRDGDVAIQEELDTARRAGTRAAYDHFIARHPDHPLAETARRERARIADAPNN